MNNIVLEGLGVNGFRYDLSQELLFIGLKLCTFESDIIKTLKVFVLFELFLQVVKTGSGMGPTCHLAQSELPIL